MKNVRKWLSLLLALALVFACLPQMSAFAADPSGKCGENLTWRLDTGTGALTISGTGPMSAFPDDTIPWKAYSEQIKSITLESGVTSISEHAFKLCINVTSAVIPYGVKTIGDYAFLNCLSLTNVTIPEGVVSVGMYAFEGCTEMDYAVIPASVTEIKSHAFGFYRGTVFVGEHLDETDLPIEGFTIYGDSGSAAEKYAKQNSIRFVQREGKASIVTFDPNGGTVEPTSLLTDLDGKLESMPIAQKQGQVFIGWWTSPTGGEELDEKAYFLTDTTLYAHWFSGTVPPVQLEYDLIVGGKRVTFSNQSDILGNGVFSFDGENTLTISGNYSSDKEIIVNEGVRGLRIVVEKDSALTSTASNAMRIQADTTITGGRLELNAPSSSKCGIYVFADKNTPSTVTLTLQNADLVVRGAIGISGPLSEHTSKTSLVVDSSNVVSVAQEDGAVCDFGGGITITGCEIEKPAGGKISDDGKSIVDTSGEAAKEVSIGSGIIPFVDISKEQYYYAPVTWAVQHDPQITTGADPTHFSPDKTCTRAQVVTFLWRAKGCQEPTQSDNPFVDVKPDAYYYKAVLWAVERNITNGVDPTHFGPDKGCTRAQVVTFLWRAEGKRDPNKTDNPFTDVKPDAYYYNAVLWAVENRITTGTSPDKFSPDATCTRGQIVTFLYRDLALVNKLLEDDFLMYIEDVFVITGRGVVLTGTVENGVLHPGDQLWVYTNDKETNAPVAIAVTCTAIEAYREVLDEARAGDSIGILIDNQDKSLFSRGDALVGYDVPMYHVTGTVVGDLYLYTKDEGGRHTPIFDSYRPQIVIGTGEAAGTVSNLTAPDGMLMPGHAAFDARISDIALPVVVYPGQTLYIRDGGRTLGEFTVKEIRNG